MPDNVLWRLNGYGTMGTMRLNELRVKYGLDYFLDHFFGLFFWTIFFFGPFHKGGGEAHHWYSGKCGMQSISTEEGVGGRVLLLREG